MGLLQKRRFLLNPDTPKTVLSRNSAYNFHKNHGVTKLGTVKVRTPTMKEKIFTWCTLANKIPTWDHIQKRQIAGPGWCSLCKDNEESTNHLFLNCNFSKQVWEQPQYLTSSSSKWEGPTLEDAWKILSTSPRTT